MGMLEPAKQMCIRDRATVEPLASQDLEASRTRVSDPHEPAAAGAAGQPRAAVPTLEPSGFEEQAGEVISIQAVAETRISTNLVANLPLDSIDKNPYQTRYVFDEEMLWELRDSIKAVSYTHLDVYKRQALLLRPWRY